MKDFTLKHGSAGSWITEDVMLVSGLPLEELDLNNKKEIRERLFTLTKAKFKYKKNITITDEPSDYGITCIVSLSDICKIDMFESTHSLKERFIVMFIGRQDYKLIDGDFLVETFKYKDGLDGFGTGSKKYIVTSTIKDVYELPVNAESEEDALEKSKHYHINDWHHLESTDSHLKDMVFVRAAKWGNFDVREVK
jgi:hypothetical protein